MELKALRNRPLGVFAVVCFLMGATFLADRAAYSLEAQQKPTTMFKVGGNYVVKKLVKNPDESFSVEFHSVAVNGRADIIKLVADHVHMGIKEGDTLRISAEVTSEKDAIVEANQVLVFIPRIEGPVPVWLLSKKGRSSELQGAEFLKMHAPQSDFQIF
jgi:hypothetical protein